jgi:hypothetical protein
MFKTMKALALTLGLTILAAAPAMAAYHNGLSSNGIWQNGWGKNGLWQNGVWQNGIWQNGIWQNGVGMTGFNQDGAEQDDHAVRVIGIELPSAPAVR